MNAKIRFTIFAVALALLFCVLGGSMADLQLRQGEAYYAQSQSGKQRTITLKGERGKILDTNGLPLAYNQKSYDVEFMRDPTRNKAADNLAYTNSLMAAIDIIEQNGYEVIDTFAIQYTPEAGFAFQWGDISEEAAQKREKNWRSNMYIPDSKKTAEEIYNYLRQRYQIPEEMPYEEARKLLSIWQEAQLTSYLSYVPVKIASNVNLATVSQIEARAIELEGISTSESTVRVYPRGEMAGNVLGYTGKITDTLLEQYAEQKYGTEDQVGITGVESSMETYLTGSSAEHQGQRVVEVNSQGKVTRELDYEAPTDGNNVVLTIDAALQKKVEDALKANIEEVVAQQKAKYEANPTKYDEVVAQRGSPLQYAEMGTAIVMEVSTGRVLALANYPSYDPNAFIGGISSEDYKALQEQTGNPLFNKAINAKSTPGSIFKMVTGLAGLMEGKITLTETMDDLGPYDKYTVTGKAPACWVKPNFSQHQNENITTALRDSCNYYFFETASRLEIDGINKWADKLGLTSKTNIELPGEATGQVANQTVLYDASKPLDEQQSSIPILVNRQIKAFVTNIAEENGIELEENNLQANLKSMMDLVATKADNQVSQIKTMLRDNLHFPEEVIRANSMDLELLNLMTELQWTPNQTIVAGIGQSMTTLTPIAVVRYVSALVNGGKVYDASLIKRIEDSEGRTVEEMQPKLVEDLEIPAQYLEAIKEGMREVVSPEDQGTAAKYFDGYKYRDQIGGKTGTAQVSTLDIENNSWFVGFAPYDEPEIAVVVFIPNGLSGALSSYTMKEIVTYYMESKEAQSEENLPTPGSMGQ